MIGVVQKRRVIEHGINSSETNMAGMEQEWIRDGAGMK
jgi:hypothetical protein